MSLFVSPQAYFQQIVREGLETRRLSHSPRVETYLVDLLQFYLDARNLFEPEHDESGQRRPRTLAEMYLTAGLLDHAARVELLKKMADRSLYISGFFGDSLNHKIIDVDYYVEMGGTAYRDLSGAVHDETLGHVYRALSEHFVDYVDVLTAISQNAFTQSNEDVLRLYDRYVKTGSELARAKLNEMGIATLPPDQTKKTRQF